jgi:hypothetical protein
VEFLRDLYFPVSQILVFHVKRVNVVVRNGMGGAVGRGMKLEWVGLLGRLFIFYIFLPNIYPCS